jgi:predicted homoserine dehydrogenase-like protein
MSEVSVPRRDFLAAGLGLATAALASSRGQAQANDRIGIGLVGCGVRGTYILNEVLAVAPGRIQVVALCDVWSRRSCPARRPGSSRGIRNC